MAEPVTVEAAGGIVYRNQGTIVEVAVVHRSRYDDWSLPKGKVESGETALDAAVREVREEIGADVAVSRRVGTVGYAIGAAQKRVTYWSMRYRGGQFQQNAEVSSLEWLPLGSATQRLTYGADRALLSDFASTPQPDALIVLVRHARAGKRSEWHGPDDLRPLDPVGVGQAIRLRSLLAVFAPDRIYSAVPLRCVQTVQPLAEALDLNVEVDAAFSDETYVRSPGTTQTALLSVAKPSSCTVVCSQGVAIPDLVEHLGAGVQDAQTKKGAFWVFSLVDGAVVAADHYDAP